MSLPRGFRLHNAQSGSALAVRIMSRASQDEIADIMEDGRIKIRLTVDPIESQANQALIKFLAKSLDITTSRIEILAGESKQDKLVVILGMDAATLQVRIEQLLKKN